MILSYVFVSCVINLNGIVIILKIFVFSVINNLLMIIIINVMINVGIRVVKEWEIFGGIIFGIFMI